MKLGATILAIILGVLALGWISEGNEFFLYKFFGPKRVAVEREIFENSKAFNQGTIQEIRNYKFEYEKVTDKNQKAALASTILHQVADYPEDKLPNDLRIWINEIRSE